MNSSIPSCSYPSLTHLLAPTLPSFILFLDLLSFCPQQAAGLATASRWAPASEPSILLSPISTRNLATGQHHCCNGRIDIGQAASESVWANKALAKSCHRAVAGLLSSGSGFPFGITLSKPGLSTPQPIYLECSLIKPITLPTPISTHIRHTPSLSGPEARRPGQRQPGPIIPPPARYTYPCFSCIDVQIDPSKEALNLFFIALWTLLATLSWILLISLYTPSLVGDYRRQSVVTRPL